MALPDPSPSEADLLGKNDTARLAYVIDQLRQLNGEDATDAPIVATSGNKANAAAVATIEHIAGSVAYLSGFDITGSGATAGAVVEVAVAGLVGGTLNYIYTAATGATVGNTPLVIKFNPPLQAVDDTTDITVTCPALGAGNTNVIVNAYGGTR